MKETQIEGKLRKVENDEMQKENNWDGSMKEKENIYWIGKFER